MKLGIFANEQIRGFTIIELLITISIIGVLSNVVLGAFNSARAKGQEAAALVELKGIEQAIQILYSDTGRYPNGSSAVCPPSSGGGNEVDLNEAAAGLVGNPGWSGWSGPYLANAVDPWGKVYYLDEDYKCTAGATGCDGEVDDPGDDNDITSVIVSCGPNGAENSGACAYDDDNIVIVFCSS